MNSEDLILPFGLPPPELARDVLRQLRAPALATLLGHAHVHRLAADPYAQVLPHQAWLLGRLGAPAALTNVARDAMTALKLKADEGNWFVVQPAHFHIARDHIVLTDLRQLTVTETQARALFESAAALFAEDGMQLVWGDARLWFLRADAWSELETSAPDMAVGHNIDIWMPRGEHARAWRRLHNEVQMSWHVHPVNDERAMAGHKPVNALWCWNAAAAGSSSGAHANQALAAFLPGWQVASTEPGLKVLDSFSPAALAGDWGRWLQAMEEAEALTFAPALDALKRGRLNQLRLVISDDRQLLQAECSAFALKKFWRRPSLDALITTREQAV